MTKTFRFCVKLMVIGALVLAWNCKDYGSDSSNPGGSGSGGDACSTGYCLNNGQCCPAASPDYTYGGHGYDAGCYASCPYVGDCGSSTQCF